MKPWMATEYFFAVKQGRLRISSQAAKRSKNDDLTNKNGVLSSTNDDGTSKNVGLEMMIYLGKSAS